MTLLEAGFAARPVTVPDTLIPDGSGRGACDAELDVQGDGEGGPQTRKETAQPTRVTCRDGDACPAGGRGDGSRGDSAPPLHRRLHVDLQTAHGAVRAVGHHVDDDLHDAAAGGPAPDRGLLDCGGLNIGGGQSATPPEGPLPDGPLPDGSINRSGLRDCTGAICAAIPTDRHAPPAGPSARTPVAPSVCPFPSSVRSTPVS